MSISTVVFSANFAAWTLFSIIGMQIKDDLQLTDTSFAILIAMPVLGGAFAQLPCGIISQQHGGRIVLFVVTLLTALALLLLPYASSLWQFLGVGLMLGLAGGTFTAGITYVSDWFTRSMQGTAMGIFGAGIAGVAITYLVAPAMVLGQEWQNQPNYYAMGLIVLAFIFWFTTSEDPKHHARGRIVSPVSESLHHLKHLRVWRFGLYYGFVFGGFISLILWLPQYYVGEYGLDLKTASFLTLLFALPASMARALGGWFADNFGARRINWMVFWIILVCLFFLSYPDTTMSIHGIDQTLRLDIRINLWVFSLLIFVVGVAMGFGKASIYRITFDYYPTSMGVVGGAVATMGSFAGFLTPILFGLAADITGIRSSCFMLLYGMLAGCMILMFYAIKLDAFQQRVKQAFEDEFLSL